MSAFNIIAIVLVITAIFAVINDRFIKLHRTIGVMLIALIASLLILVAKFFGLIHDDVLTKMITQFHFSETLIQGMLGALLFAGAIHIRSDDLRPRLIPIAVMATCGVLISTFIVGYLIYYALHFLSSINLPLMYCFTFAALISPTDPIAVLAILRSIGVSKGLDMDVCGESLFNDGIGLVVFTFFVSLAVNAENMGALEVSLFFLQNVGGALILGAVSSYLVFKMMGSVSDYHIEILLSLALVFGSFQFAEWIGVSPAITSVMVGLVFGHLCYKNMTEKSRSSMYTFWEVIDEVLNTVLFVMVGIVLLLVQFDAHRIVLGIFAIIIVLFGRWVSVAIPVSIMQKWFYFSPRSILILTWGGLRGGLSIAMALTLPNGEYKEYILLMTYAVVVFSILIQGTTVGRLAGSRKTHGNEYRDPRLNEEIPPEQ
ncbi:sodium:proton antiporter [Cardiobacteriaceae bacterium TAE3-ERU3]|nr:sodium:proton antiporter [Cardiobacteriaceae bacterium TAE3-ERU3]